MEFINGIRRLLGGSRKVEVVAPPATLRNEIVEKSAKDILRGLYTNPSLLTSLAEVAQQAAFNLAEKPEVKIDPDLGPLFSHWPGLNPTFLASHQELIRSSRERALSHVPESQRTAVEIAAIVTAGNILTAQLRSGRLDQIQHAGASEMLKRIEV